MSLHPFETTPSIIAAASPPDNPARRLPLLPDRPLVPFTLAFAGGILAVAFPPAPILLFALFVAMALGIRWSARRGTGAVAVSLALFAAAGSLRQLEAAYVSPLDVSRQIGGPIVTIHGAVVDEPEPAHQVVTATVKVDRIERADGSSAPCLGLLRCALGTSIGNRTPDPGDEITVRGRIEAPEQARNPGAFDERTWLAARGIHATVFARRAGAWKLGAWGGTPAWSPHRLAVGLRASLRETANRYLGRLEAPLLCGILLGSRTDLPHSVADDFQVTGTAHILATAGLHIGLVALLARWAFRRVGLSRSAAAGLVMALLVAYAMAAAGRPAVVRAVVVAEVFLAGTLLQREPDPWNSLALAALVLLAWQPGNLFDAGFQMSFATVASIIAIVSVAQPYFGCWSTIRLGTGRQRAVRVKERIAELLVLTAAAQIGSAPLVAEYFNLVSPAGFPANLLIVPLLVPVIGFGLVLWAATAIGIPAIPSFAATVLGPLLRAIWAVARLFGRLPAAAFAVPSPGPLGIGIYYLALAVILRWASRRAPGGRAADPPPVGSEPAAEGAAP